MNNFSNNNVFITKSNMKAIIQPLNFAKFSSVDLLAENFGSQDLGFILSATEQNWLKAFKSFCENPSLILDEKYQKIARCDTKRFVFEEEESKTAFHKKDDCERLLSDFEDYPIPAKIKALGDDKITEYRVWFEEHMSLLTSGLESDKAKFEMLVGIKFKVNNVSVAVRYDNTGVVEFENTNLASLENDISVLLTEAARFKNSDEATRKQIQNCSNGMHRTDLIFMADVKIPGTTLHIWANYKNKLKELIVAYFMVKLNVDCSFEQSLLEELNFKKCACCHD